EVEHGVARANVFLRVVRSALEERGDTHVRSTPRREPAVEGLFRPELPVGGVRQVRGDAVDAVERSAIGYAHESADLEAVITVGIAEVHTMVDRALPRALAQLAERTHGGLVAGGQPFRLPQLSGEGVRASEVDELGAVRLVALDTRRRHSPVEPV